MRFSISQHSRDFLLLESFIKFFARASGGGFVLKHKTRSIGEFVVAKFDIIFDHIIPFFDNHPILGSKHSNFLDFNKAAYIIKKKEHLNKDRVGLEQILQLKQRITLVNSNKAINNHSVEAGTEKSDQKR